MSKLLLVRLLPAATSDEEVTALRTDQGAWSPALSQICDIHGLRGPATVLPEGSAIVGATESHIIKFFEPWNHGHYDTEVGGLRFLEGETTTPTPRIDAVGEIEGWNYVVMTRLVGETLDLVWSETTRGDRRRIAHQLGEFAAEMHTLSLHDLTGVDRDWDSFTARQRAGLITHHRQRGGVSPALLHDLESLVAEWLPDPHRVFLHTELTSGNITVARKGDDWHLAGVFDLEPAMVGAPTYDWGALSIFIARGDASVLAAAVAGYGADIDASDPAWRKAVLAQILLHRYSNIPHHLRLQAAPEPADISELLDLLVPALER
jgi:hygromycin-B 7''-O-kinase